MNPLISKARKPKFELVLRIYDLNNVPLATGTSHIKWHLPSSTSAEHRGRTERAPITSHRVTWDYVKTIPVRLTIDKSSSLQETLIQFEVFQDYTPNGAAGSGKGDKGTLGKVELNLAEYVDVEGEGERGEGEEGVVRRYLMQESKINSTLKIGIHMKQIDGERNFVAPTLKTAAVFGGIAGIMAGEQVENDDLGSAVPMISKGRDQSDLQDMYRRALAASWAAQPDELPADQCIEDIFSGGDGWKGGYAKTISKLSAKHKKHEDEVGEMQMSRHQRTGSDGSLGSFASQSTVKGGDRMRLGHRKRGSRGEMGHGGATQDQDGNTSSNDSERGRAGFRSAHEVDEFEMRDDLIAWKLPVAKEACV